MTEDQVGNKDEEQLTPEDLMDPQQQGQKASSGPVDKAKMPAGYTPPPGSTFPFDPTAYPTAPGGAPGQQNFTDPKNKPASVPLTTGFQNPSPYSFKPEDWLGFSQKTTGQPNTSRGGSNGGFIPGGGAYRGQLQAMVDQFNKEFHANAKVAGDDKIDFGDGRGPQDVITAGGDFWYGGPMGGATGGASGSGGGGGATSPPSSPTAGFGSQDEALHKAIMDLLGRGSNPLTADDPTLRAQFDPISRTLQRGAQRTREQAAERLSFEGLNMGGQGGPLDADVNAINESLGEQEGAAMGKFVTSELNARRQDVVNALQLAQGEQRIALQAQLQEIDAQIRRQALNQQNTQFYDTFSSNLADKNNSSDRDFLDWLTR